MTHLQYLLNFLPILLLITFHNKALQTCKLNNITFTINTIHSNTQTHPTIFRTLSRPPLPVILNNPLSYNLASTNAKNVQQPIPSAASLSQPTSFQMNSLSTSQVAQVPSTTIRTNQHNYTTNTFPITGTQNVQHILPTSNVKRFVLTGNRSNFST